MSIKLIASNKKARYDYKILEKFEGSYSFSSNEVKTGLGLMLKNYWNTKFEYFFKYDDFQLEKNLFLYVFL